VTEVPERRFDEATRVLVTVAAITRATGAAPTWSELGRKMGWPSSETAARIRELRSAGLRWRDREERSLNVPSWALERAFATIREQRESRS
jgi:hypothetical protein